MVRGLAASVPGVAPLPESGMVREGLEAVLVIAIPPVTLPLAVGVNVAVNVVL